MNKIFLSGNLGNEPSLRTAGGKDVCNLRLGVSSGRGDNKKTNWYDVVIWGEQAQRASQLRKGARIFIEGRPDIRLWKDKEGKERTSVEVNCDGFEYGDSKPQNGASSYGHSEPQGEADFAVDGLPF